MTENAKVTPAATGSNIDQVRDILFGTQIRESNSRFEKLETELQLLKSETRDRIEQTRNVLLTELRAVAEGIEKKLKSVDRLRQEEIDSVRQASGRTSQELSSNLQQLEEAIDEQIAGVRRDLVESKDTLHNSLYDLRTQINETLEQHVSKLQDSKVSRENVAEILMELALRLRGTEILPDLPLDLNVEGFTTDQTASDASS